MFGKSLIAKSSLLLLLTGFAAASLSVSSAQSVAYQSNFGTFGNGDGQFGVVNSVAVYNATGQVSVSDQSNYRVSRFSAAGDFQISFGSSGS